MNETNSHLQEVVQLCVSPPIVLRKRRVLAVPKWQQHLSSGGAGEQYRLNAAAGWPHMLPIIMLASIHTINTYQGIYPPPPTWFPCSLTGQSIDQS